MTTTQRTHPIRILGWVMSVAVLTFLHSITATPPAHAGTGDDYPAKWRNASLDSLTDDWRYYNRECTSWVAWALHSRNGFEMPAAIGNGANWGVWAGKNGNTPDSTPAVGAVAWWGQNTSDQGFNVGTAGHVAWVSAVNGSTVTVEEYNRYVNGAPDGAFHTRTMAASNAKYIHFKDIKPAAATVSEADFVRVVGTNEVYRIAGGAPIYVTSWSVFGGPQTVKEISATQFGQLHSTPVDGAFVRGAQSSEIYRIAGGAPIYVSTWSAFGGSQPYTDVDQAAIDNAGHGGIWNHLNYSPPDGTYIRGAQTGRIYKISSATPSWLNPDQWKAAGPNAHTTDVDQTAIDNAGTGGKWNHLNKPQN